MALRWHRIAFPTLPSSRLSMKACVRCLELQARQSLHHHPLRHSTKNERTTLPQRVVYFGARRACWHHHSCMCLSPDLHRRRSEPGTSSRLHRRFAALPCLKKLHTCSVYSKLPSIRCGLVRVSPCEPRAPPSGAISISAAVFRNTCMRRGGACEAASPWLPASTSLRAVPYVNVSASSHRRSLATAFDSVMDISDGLSCI